MRDAVTLQRCLSLAGCKPRIQGWGEYSTYEYEYWKISTRVALEYNVFSIFMFIILGKTSTRVVLAPALLESALILHVQKDNIQP